jgi:hypothetical protein
LNPEKISRLIFIYLFLIALNRDMWSASQSDQKFEKNCPIFGNVTQTVAKLQKLKFKVENSSTKLHLNI